MKEKILSEMKKYFGLDEKRIEHAYKVLKYAEEIAEKEQIIDNFILDVINYSAILHDIGIHEAERKYNSSAGKFQEIEGPPIAEAILSKLNIDKDIIDRVLYIVGNHHTFNKIDNIDFQILWEADLLVNLEEKSLNHDPQHHLQIEKTFSTYTGKEKLKKLYGNLG